MEFEFNGMDRESIDKEGIYLYTTLGVPTIYLIKTSKYFTVKKFITLSKVIRNSKNTLYFFIFV